MQEVAPVPVRKIEKHKTLAAGACLPRVGAYEFLVLCIRAQKDFLSCFPALKRWCRSALFGKHENGLHRLGAVPPRDSHFGVKRDSCDIGVPETLTTNKMDPSSTLKRTRHLPTNEIT
jgi:hypothetical protein